MMTAPLLATSPLATSQGIYQAVSGDTPDVFADIYRSDVNMAVWRRPITPPLLRDCRALFNHEGQTSHRQMVPAARLSNLHKTLPERDAYPHLIADIQLLGEMFSCLFDLSAIGLRLATLTRAMCPRFHVDHVPCRLARAS